MKKLRKKIAVLNITSRCNLACGFCFGPEVVAAPFRVRNNGRLEPAATDLTTIQAKNLILNFKKSGVKIIIFSGGEPLLRSDIFKLICFAKKQRFYTVLHTNGMLLKLKTQSSRLIKQLNYLDQINLPLDGHNAKTNDAMRCRGHFKKVMQALKLLRNSKIRVIISTVATVKNKDSVAKIGAILPSWVYKWRIFQFNPQGKASQVKQEFAISDREFKKISRQARNFRFKVQCVGMKDRKFWGSYELI